MLRWVSNCPRNKVDLIQRIHTKKLIIGEPKHRWGQSPEELKKLGIVGLYFEDDKQD